MDQGYDKNFPYEATGRIAFIQACWHKDIVDQAKHSFVAEIGKLGFSKKLIDLYEVPGSFEIPLQASFLAKTGRYAAIVAAGLIVDGGIYRHEFVANAVITGMMQVQLKTKVPVLSLVLTPQHFEEQGEHKEFFMKHFVIKGAEAAQACAQTIKNIERLKVQRTDT